MAAQILGGAHFFFLWQAQKSGGAKAPPAPLEITTLPMLFSARPLLFVASHCHPKGREVSNSVYKREQRPLLTASVEVLVSSLAISVVRVESALVVFKSSAC